MTAEGEHPRRRWIAGGIGLFCVPGEGLDIHWITQKFIDDF